MTQDAKIETLVKVVRKLQEAVYSLASESDEDGYTKNSDAYSECNEAGDLLDAIEAAMTPPDPRGQRPSYVPARVPGEKLDEKCYICNRGLVNGRCVTRRCDNHGGGNPT